MSQGKSHHLGLGLLAVTWLTTSPAVFADPTLVAPPGYKIVNVPAGDRTIPVMVKQQGNPFTSSSTGVANGTQKSFGERSPMADKTFTFDRQADAHQDSAARDTFVTKAYQDPSATNGSRFDTKANLPIASGYNHAASNFDHRFETSTAEEQTHASSFAGTSTSSDQNRSAALGGAGTGDLLTANSMATKQYLGPGAQKVPAAYPIADNVVVSRMSGLPNRPLSIDEVRNLINHGVQIDTDVKPEEASKPLNDPAYQPRPLRDTSTRADQDDKDDPVPAPGMIAAPESAEPLPQK